MLDRQHLSGISRLLYCLLESSRTILTLKGGEMGLWELSVGGLYDGVCRSVDYSTNVDR